MASARIKPAHPKGHGDVAHKMRKSKGDYLCWQITVSWVIFAGTSVYKRPNSSGNIYRQAHDAETWPLYDSPFSLPVCLLVHMAMEMLRPHLLWITLWIVTRGRKG